MGRNGEMVATAKATAKTVPERPSRQPNGLARARTNGDGLTPTRERPPDAQAHAPDSLVAIQRARILAAMVDVCVELGAPKVTVANVVARAGVSRRTFYEIFASRQECFLEAFDDGVARAAAHVREACDPSAKWVERVRCGVVALLEFIDLERATAELLIVGSLGVGGEALGRRQEVIDRLAAVVDEGRNQTKAGAELPPLTAEGVVGGALSVLHSRLLALPRPLAVGDHDGEREADSLLALAGPLTSMVVLPYLGAAAARRELRRPVPARPARPVAGLADPLRDLEIRLTYRTVRVLLAVAEGPGGSNREVGLLAGIPDQGQVSKLLARVQRLGLVLNTGATPGKGAANSWALTERGRQVGRAMSVEANGQGV